MVLLIFLYIIFYPLIIPSILEIVNTQYRNPSLGMPIPLKIEMPRLTACPNDCENGRV